MIGVTADESESSVKLISHFIEGVRKCPKTLTPNQRNHTVSTLWNPETPS